MSQETVKSKLKLVNLEEKEVTHKIFLKSAPRGALKTVAMMKEALERRGIEFRENLRKKDIEWRVRAKSDCGKWKGEWEWEEIQDKAQGWIIIEFEEKCSYRDKRNKWHPFSLPSNRLQNMIEHLCLNHAYDPMLDYLNQLPEWDGKPRIDNALTELFWADDTPLNRFASSAIWIGAIQRTLDPGCKLDEIVILQGQSGCGKTAYFREMVPQPDLYEGGAKVKSDHKEMTEVMDGALIIEFQDLSGMNQADLGLLKQIITITHDKVRKAYARRANRTPRRNIFVGSTDKEHFLPADGPNNNRRFIVVKLQRKRGDGDDIEGGLVEVWMVENRDQCWAEALHRYKAGERANLPKDLLKEAARINRERVWTNKDVRDFLHSPALYRFMNEQDVEGTALIDRRVGIQLKDLRDMMKAYQGGSGNAQRYLTKTLEELGWEYKQRSKKYGRARSYRVPEDWEFHIATEDLQ